MNKPGSTRHKSPVTHRWLYALKALRLPDSVNCSGEDYTLVGTFKHDFFAATGHYRGAVGDAVLKLGRSNDLLCLPLKWIGRLLTRRETQLYELVQDLPGVPGYLGQVGTTGFMHVFVPGHPLQRHEAVSDTFFDELTELVNTLHARSIAYVDLNKRQNILVGDDGKPYLIDFQISLWFPRRGWRGRPLLQWLLRRFQQADAYHVLKHKRRLRPDLLTPAERARVERIGPWIRLHRLVARPLTQLRRRLLGHLQKGDRGEVAGSSAK